ncbi:DUF4198 domain-containing protein [Loktanella sp. DJP18]|uniref:DUF4198 domain-containing protein n=1 Tax=Loktanella sp. DJP18 TaxID=3409788 RepID=UPI003BB6274E
MRRLFLAFAVLASPVSAHELWLEPQDYTVSPEATLNVQIVNGSDFEGQNLPYLPQRFVRFDDVVDGSTFPIPGRIGDIPAVQINELPEGLNVLVYQARNATVDYDDWETFVRFSEHKAFPGILAAHSARGFAEEPFKEVYSRYSKALVAVGEGTGQDSRTGLETEIVALTNPYADDTAEGMSFQLWYGDQPRAAARFEVYDRSPAGDVTQTFYTTDAQGMVTVPVAAGHTYMADAVLIREPAEALAEETGALWETLWANITWAVPG